MAGARNGWHPAINDERNVLAALKMAVGSFVRLETRLNLNKEPRKITK